MAKRQELLALAGVKPSSAGPISSSRPEARSLASFSGSGCRVVMATESGAPRTFRSWSRTASAASSPSSSSASSNTITSGSTRSRSSSPSSADVAALESTGSIRAGSASPTTSARPGTAARNPSTVAAGAGRLRPSPRRTRSRSNAGRRARAPPRAPSSSRSRARRPHHRAGSSPSAIDERVPGARSVRPPGRTRPILGPPGSPSRIRSKPVPRVGRDVLRTPNSRGGGYGSA